MSMTRNRTSYRVNQGLNFMAGTVAATAAHDYGSDSLLPKLREIRRIEMRV